MGINISKKWITNQYPEITLSNVFSVSLWWQIFTNPFTILTLGVSLGTFALTLCAFSMTEANNIILASIFVSLPAFLVNLYFNYKTFGETVTVTQYAGLFISIVGILLVGTGAWLFTGGIK